MTKALNLSFSVLSTMLCVVYISRQSYLEAIVWSLFALFTTIDLFYNRSKIVDSLKKAPYVKVLTLGFSITSFILGLTSLLLHRWDWAFIAGLQFGISLTGYLSTKAYGSA